MKPCGALKANSTAVLLRYSKDVTTAAVTNMCKQWKDKKPESSSLFRKFEELTKNLLAVSNTEVRGQEEQEKKGDFRREVLSSLLDSSLVLGKLIAAPQPSRAFSQTYPYIRLRARCI